MAVLRSRLDPTAPETRANHEAMAALVADLRRRQAEVAGRGAGGDERSIARHRERGKLPVRERIDRLLDPGTGFLELSPLAADGLYDGDAPSAGIVTGLGRVEDKINKNKLAALKTPGPEILVPRAFTGDNGLPWLAAVRRPELFLWQEWAVAMRGDAVAAAVVRDSRYSLEKSIMVEGAPAIEIYRRTGGNP